jgi:hypothetical protein
MSRRCSVGFFLFALLFTTPIPAQYAVGQTAEAQESAAEAVPTKVVVRAVSHDAKLVQDPVGGARITIQNAATGEVLAEGRQTGDSGSTEKIMRQPRKRGATTFDVSGAAKYETTLSLKRPTRVRITAEGPLDYPQAMQTASKTVLLVPGEDVTGDGITLNLHGFIVEVLEVEPSQSADGTEARIRARIRMMCGCPTKPGGLWDADRYTIRAQLLHEGRVVDEVPLAFAGTTSEYAGTLSLPGDTESGEGGPGAESMQVRVLASDAERVNFGMATTNLGGEAEDRWP